MIKQILSALALSAVTVAPAFASLQRISTDRYYATDANNDTHYIDYVRMDHEGDVQIRVTVNGNSVYHWVNCRTDQISLAGDLFDGWEYVDHRKMQGYYSDVACRQ